MTDPRFQQEEVGPTDDWYLSFDCATKSFAFALVRLRPPPKIEMVQMAEAVAAGDWAAARRGVDELDLATRACFLLAGGGGADLVPGKINKKISTVERIRAVKAYLDGPVAAALTAAAALGCPPPDSSRLNVLVEFQMGPNSPARTVAAALLTNYCHANVILVGPAYKNKLWYPSRADLRHACFLEQYSTCYSANKKHTKALYFNHIAPVFGHDKELFFAKLPTKFHSDFADAVLQVLGFRAFGDSKKSSERF